LGLDKLIFVNLGAHNFDLVSIKKYPEPLPKFWPYYDDL